MIGYQDWCEARLDALQAEDGWLNLIARLDLGLGWQSVGSGPDCALRLDCGPLHLGDVAAQGETAAFRAPTGESLAFQPGAGGFPVLRAEPFLLELHTVDGQPALRVRDLTKPRTAALRRFAFAPNWVISAQWVALDAPKVVEFGQKGGANLQTTLTHAARFDHEGQTVDLLPTHWKNGVPMFVIRDATSGRESYAASRFLMGEDMTQDSLTLDFNRAFSPPCAFTDFAICPLPPRQNILPFAVEAGEYAPGL